MEEAGRNTTSSAAEEAIGMKSVRENGVSAGTFPRDRGLLLLVRPPALFNGCCDAGAMLMNACLAFPVVLQRLFSTS